MTTVSQPRPTSWTDHYHVDPCAAAYPPLGEDELSELAEDIRQHGLVHPVVYRRGRGRGGPLLIVDGRNRLNAIASLGIAIPSDPSKKVRLPNSAEPVVIFKSFEGTQKDVASFVISSNDRRRHLTKEQRAARIIAVVEAAEGRTIEAATTARSFNTTDKGKGGSTKNPVAEQVLLEAKQAGISERTTRAAMAKRQGKTPKKATSTSSSSPKVHTAKVETVVAAPSASSTVAAASTNQVDVVPNPRGVIGELITELNRLAASSSHETVRRALLQIVTDPASRWRVVDMPVEKAS
jgi:hypothetical protein